MKYKWDRWKKITFREKAPALHNVYLLDTKMHQLRNHSRNVLEQDEGGKSGDVRALEARNTQRIRTSKQKRTHCSNSHCWSFLLWGMNLSLEPVCRGQGTRLSWSHLSGCSLTKCIFLLPFLFVRKFSLLAQLQRSPSGLSEQLPTY